MSIPLANPLIMHILFSDNAFENRFVISTPYLSASLVPTIATISFLFNNLIFPTAYNTLGLLGIFFSLSGKSESDCSIFITSYPKILFSDIYSPSMYLYIFVLYFMASIMCSFRILKLPSKSAIVLAILSILK